jgi:predicted nucleic acid-binding protein
MVHRLFLDANVILDYALKRPKWYRASKSILEKVAEGEYEGTVSPVAVHIVSYILGKHLGSENTKKIMLALLNDVMVIDTPHKVILQAMSADWPDIEDSIQYFTALHHRVDLIVSRDEGLIKKAMPALPVIHPEDFVKTF